MSVNDQGSVRLEVTCDPPIFSMRAYAQNQFVGKLLAVLQSEGVVLLSEIWVENQVPTTSTSKSRILRMFQPKPQFESFRGRGIGALMLTRFFDWCREQKFSDVYGSIVKADLDQRPWLIEWYERRGFEIHPPDDRCLKNAVCMVVWTSGS